MKGSLFLSHSRVEGGELFDRVVDKGKFTEPVAKLYFYQMLSAVKVTSTHCVYRGCLSLFFHPVPPRQRNHAQRLEGNTLVLLKLAVL